jgi:hypothetical protein
MPWLKEHVATLTSRAGYEETRAAVVAALADLELTIDETGSPSGTLAVRCLTVVANWLVWRCWSDKLLVAIHPAGEQSRVSLHVVPNLWRTGLQAGETATDVAHVVGALRRALEAGATRPDNNEVKLTRSAPAR